MLTAFVWFVTVIETGSMNRAAMKLGQPQPALSRKLRALEKELGVALFDRTGKKLVLTRAGQIAYEHATRMLAQQKAFQQQMTAFQIVSERGKLTIGASLTTLQATLPELIRTYRSEHPLIDIHAVTGKTHEIVSFVREKKVDLGVVAARVDQPDIVCIPLFEDHLCLVMPSEMTILHKPILRTFQSIHDLEGLPMVLFSSGTWYRVMMDQLFANYRIQPDVHLEIDSFEAILRLVLSCNVAALLPESYVTLQLQSNPDLRIVSIPELEKATRTTSLIYADPTQLSPNTHRFIEHVRAQFERHNPHPDRSIQPLDRDVHHVDLEN